jgi:hypothetical protein
MSLSLSSITYGHLQGKLPLNGGRGNSWVVSAYLWDNWNGLADKIMLSRC